MRVFAESLTVNIGEKEQQSFPEGLKASQLKNIVSLEPLIKGNFSKKPGSGLRKGDLLRVLGTDRK